MIGFIDIINDKDAKIEENLEKIRQERCDNHNKHQASYCCINPSCVKNSLCFLCELCYNNHDKKSYKFPRNKIC